MGRGKDFLHVPFVVANLSLRTVHVKFPLRQISIPHAIIDRYPSDWIIGNMTDRSKRSQMKLTFHITWTTSMLGSEGGGGTGGRSKNSQTVPVSLME
jgi:hypothetical protein